MSVARRSSLAAAFAVLVALSQAPAVRADGPGSASLAGGAGNAVDNMQGALLADPESRDQVLSLGDDPQVKAILDDPATMRAVQAGDLSVLMNDPKIRALLQNPTVRGLVDKQSR